MSPQPPCTLCHYAPQLLDALCEPCWRKQRLSPYDKQIEQAQRTVAQLQSQRLELERRLYEARYALYAQAGSGSQLDAQRRVIFYYCTRPGCAQKFQFRSEQRRHMEKCAEQQAERLRKHNEARNNRRETQAPKSYVAQPIDIRADEIV